MKHFQLGLKVLDPLVAGFDALADQVGLLFRDAPLHLLERLKQEVKLRALDPGIGYLLFQARRAGLHGVIDGCRLRGAVRVEDVQRRDGLDLVCPSRAGLVQLRRKLFLTRDMERVRMSEETILCCSREICQ